MSAAPTTVSAAAEEPAVLLRRQGAVAVITLNRPRAMNAVNSALSAGLGAALEELDNDDSLRVGVLTGAGRAFCAGMDLKAYAAGEEINAPGHPEWGFAGFCQHWISKPVIAAVNGFAMGGGMELVLAADLAVAAESAKLGLPEVGVGVVAAAGGALRLPRQVPKKLALEMLLTGEPVTAARAAELGVVNREVADDRVLPVALEIAERIARNAPLAVKATKTLAYEQARYADDWSDELWAYQQSVIDPVFSSNDALEGARAFAEKRQPSWSGS